LFKFFQKVDHPVNIVFLDIDGVLLINNDGEYNLKAFNDQQDFIKSKLGDNYSGLDKFDIGATVRFNPNAIENLKTLCKNYDAKIVISSSWRISDDREGSMVKLTSLFKLWDLDSLIIDVTPTTHKSRAHEIQQWLDNAGYKIASYIILDDVDSCLSKQFGEKYIHTGDTMYFSAKHYEQAISIFAQKSDGTLIHADTLNN
jgi:hypothetical protein